MEQWLPFIQEYGFPMVFIFYLLHRIEGKLDTLNQSILKIPNQLSGSSSYSSSEHTKKTV